MHDAVIFIFLTDGRFKSIGVPDACGMTKGKVNIASGTVPLWQKYLLNNVTSLCHAVGIWYANRFEATVG